MDKMCFFRIYQDPRPFFGRVFCTCSVAIIFSPVNLWLFPPLSVFFSTSPLSADPSNHSLGCAAARSSAATTSQLRSQSFHDASDDGTCCSLVWTKTMRPKTVGFNTEKWWKMIEHPVQNHPDRIAWCNSPILCNHWCLQMPWVMVQKDIRLKDLGISGHWPSTNGQNLQKLTCKNMKWTFALHETQLKKKNLPSRGFWCQSSGGTTGVRAWKLVEKTSRSWDDQKNVI